MKFGVLQFFSWPGRRVSLPTVYERAMQRIEIMDKTGYDAVWLGVICTGLIVSLFDFKPLSVIIFAQVANGIVLPVASIFLLIVLNNRKKMGALANNTRQNILGVLVILVVSFLGIWNIVKLLVQ